MSSGLFAYLWESNLKLKGGGKATTYWGSLGTGKSEGSVPIPANGYSSIPVSICEPYRKWKEWEIPDPPGRMGKNKSPNLN